MTESGKPTGGGHKDKSFFRYFLELFYKLPDDESHHPMKSSAVSPINVPKTQTPVVNFEEMPKAVSHENISPENSSDKNIPLSSMPPLFADESIDDHRKNQAVTVSKTISVVEPKPETHKSITRPPVVTFKNVTKIFNPGTPLEFKAVENISFKIDDLPNVGEFIALIGPSGCGKSTVLNLIQGFPEVWPPTSGEILVRNEPVTGPGKDRGMIFQKYSSFPHLTVLQNVLFGLEINGGASGRSYGEMKSIALQMIKKVGLTGHELKYPYQLSGGQQQRVAIARTLVLKPRIILMDEPFSALDEPTRVEMQELITQLWTEVEATVFIVTHSVAEAVYLGDRIFIFTPAPGRLVKEIPIKPDDIGKAPGVSPLEVQEGPKFKSFLKDVTKEFLRIEGGRP